MYGGREGRSRGGRAAGRGSDLLSPRGNRPASDGPPASAVLRAAAGRKKAGRLEDLVPVVPGEAWVGTGAAAGPPSALPESAPLEAEAETAAAGKWRRSRRARVCRFQRLYISARGRAPSPPETHTHTHTHLGAAQAGAASHRITSPRIARPCRSRGPGKVAASGHHFCAPETGSGSEGAKRAAGPGPARAEEGRRTGSAVFALAPAAG